MDELVTISDLANRYGRDRRTVRKLLGDTQPASTSTVAGKVVRRWRLTPEIEGLLTAVSDRDKLGAAFEQLHAARAEILRLKRGLRDGTRLPMDQVVLEWETRILDARSACLSLPSRLYPGITQALALGGDPLPALRRIFRREAQEIVDDFKRPFSWQETKK